jgi:hypothetical protein
MGPQGPQGPQGIPGETSSAVGALTIIPFASHYAFSVSTNSDGTSRMVILMSFVSNASTSTVISPTGTITLPTASQVSFSLPFDCVIESISATIGAASDFVSLDGITVYPYVQLYSASNDSNVFTPLQQAVAFPSQGYSGDIPANTLRYATTTQPTTILPAGTRILIVGKLLTTSTGTESMQLNHPCYFSGGIGIRAVT